MKGEGRIELALVQDTREAWIDKVNNTADIRGKSWH